MFKDDMKWPGDALVAHTRRSQQPLLRRSLLTVSRASNDGSGQLCKCTYSVFGVIDSTFWLRHKSSNPFRYPTLGGALCLRARRKLASGSDPDIRYALDVSYNICTKSKCPTELHSKYLTIPSANTAHTELASNNKPSDTTGMAPDITEALGALAPTVNHTCSCGNDTSAHRTLTEGSRHSKS